MDDILFNVLQTVIILVTGVVSRYVIPWIRVKLDSEKVTQVTSFIQSAVNCAEQIINGQGLGAEKKVYVTELVQKYLGEHKYKISEEQINLLIEAAVKSMNTNRLEK